MPWFESQDFRVDTGVNDFEPHSAPRHARAAGDVARKVSGEVRWSLAMLEPWDGQESGLAEMSWGKASLSSRDFYGMYARTGPHGSKTRVQLRRESNYVRRVVGY